MDFHGPLSKRTTDENIDEVRILLKGVSPDIAGAQFSHFETERYAFEKHPNGITRLIFEECYSAAMFGFTDNYDFQNRDYNLPLHDFEQGLLDTSSIYAQMKQRFVDFGTVKISETIDTQFYFDNRIYLIDITTNLKSQIKLTITEVPKVRGRKQFRRKDSDITWLLPQNLIEVEAIDLFTKWETSNNNLRNLYKQFHSNSVIQEV